MVQYRLALLPLAEAMMSEDPGVLQPCYADKSGMRSTARWNSNLLHSLMGKVPHHRYFPEPEKSWHICAEEK